MAALERAGGPEYDIAADPGGSEWVATQKARFEGERARERGAEMPRNRRSSRESRLGGQTPHAE
jgi:hypothetical protein